MPTYIPIEDAVAACAAAGNSLPPGLQPILSDLKRETSLIGQAYLNYIYQNDIANAHFCQAMLLMHAQVPNGTPGQALQGRRGEGTPWHSRDVIPSDANPEETRK